MTDPGLPQLTTIEARVLAVLVEKQFTVPDTYPMTINALLAGCNQKTSRDPVMSLDEPQVQQALDTLRQRSFVIESSGSRVMRYAQNMRRVLGVPAESVALLATLMLRGPQTAAELRANAERLQRFSDASALEGFLEELAAWPAGPLVTRLARQPGAREQRWAHLLCGMPEDADGGTGRRARAAPEPIDADTQARIERLEARVAGLEDALGRLCEELGLGRPQDAPR